MNKAKLESFEVVYREGLRAAVETDVKKPSAEREYAYGVEHVDFFVDKMIAAIRKEPMSVSYDSKGFKRTCKLLGIKSTRKAILEYLEV